MKKALLAFLALVALMVCLWALLRKSTHSRPAQQVDLSFQTETAGAGQLIALKEPDETTTHELRWATTEPSGYAVAQVLDPSGEQAVAIFLDAKFQKAFRVTSLSKSLDEALPGAELKQAILVPGDLLLLLYAATSGKTETDALILALDWKQPALRWAHRAPGEAMALSPGKGDAAVFVYGYSSPITRLPLASSEGDSSEDLSRKAQETISLPAEVKGMASLLPTGSKTFLVAHAGGLSACSKDRKWKHTPLPDPGALGFAEPQGALAFTDHGLWWQPRPGLLLQVDAEGQALKDQTLEGQTLEGQTLETRGPTAALAGTPLEKDGHLLNLLGSDADGRLWFSLVAPILWPPETEPDPPVPTSLQAEEGWETESSTKPEAPRPSLAQDQHKAWQAHLSAGLDRLYRWDPRTRELKRMSWSAAWKSLGAPPTIPQPESDAGLHPASGALLLGPTTQTWWLPMKALPMN